MIHFQPKCAVFGGEFFDQSSRFILFIQFKADFDGEFLQSRHLFQIIGVAYFERQLAKFCRSTGKSRNPHGVVADRDPEVAVFFLQFGCQHTGFRHLGIRQFLLCRQLLEPFHADFIRFAELVSLFPKRAHLV